MEIIKGLDDKFTRPSAVTIGKFDGIHKGHGKLIDRTLYHAKCGCTSVMFTFDISENDNLYDGRQYIYTAEEKRIILKNSGIDILVEYPFTKDISHMTPEKFFCDILKDKMNVKAVIVGEDFRFGYKRKGDICLLSDLCSKNGVELEVIEKECFNGSEIGSTRIRSELLSGNINIVNRMLGRPYSIYGTVEYGKQLGRKLDMPTANISVGRSKLIPPKGVYASLVVYKNTVYKGVTNIGTRPTVEGNGNVSIETYIFDFDKNIYGENIIVQLLEFKRPEMKFDSLLTLREQMHRDKEETSELIDSSYPGWNMGVYF